MRNGSRISVMTGESTYSLVVVATGPDFLLIEKREPGHKNDLLPVLRKDVKQVWAIASADLHKDVRRGVNDAVAAEAAAEERRDDRYARERYNAQCLRDQRSGK